MRELLYPKCNCKCHIKGNTDIIFDCCHCDIRGDYINKDGSVDLTAYNNLLRFFHPRKAPYIDGGEYIVKNKYNYDSSQVKDKRK
jgi:hypothetical protein